MLAIRLARFGAKKQPKYRIVVIDKERPRDGRFNEVLGHYNPLANPSVVQLDMERVQYWLGKGAQPSDRVRQLIDRQPKEQEQVA